MKDRQEQYVQPDEKRRVEKPLDGEEGRVALGPDKVGAEAVVAGGDDEGREEKAVRPDRRDSLQEGDDRQRPGGAQGDDPEPHGEGLRPLPLPVRREAEHRVRDVQGHQGDEKVRRLGDEVGGAVLRRGQVAGVKPDHQEYQQLGAEGAGAHQDRVGGKGLILIHAAAFLRRGSSRTIRKARTARRLVKSPRMGQRDWFIPSLRAFL